MSALFCVAGGHRTPVAATPQEESGNGVDVERRGTTRRVLGAMALCALLLCGCVDVSMPAYQRPDTPAKDSWSNTSVAVSAADTIEPDWWKGFRTHT